MKTRIAVIAFGAALIVAGLFSVAAFAQPDPNAPPPPGVPGGPPPMMGMMGPMRPEMLAVPSGLYVLRGDSLVKFSPAMAKLGELTLAAQRDNGDEFAPRPPMSGAMMLAPGGNETLLLVQGDTLYRINGKTVKIAGQVELPKVDMPKIVMPAPPPPFIEDGIEMGEPDANGIFAPPAPGGPGGMGPGRPGRLGGMAPGGPGMMFMQQQPATLEINGNNLYIQRGPSIVSVNIETMKVLGETTLTPPAPPEEEEE